MTDRNDKRRGRGVGGRGVRGRAARAGHAFTKPAVVAAVALVAVTLALASCGGGGPSPSPSATVAAHPSGIRGIVLLAGGPYVASPPPLPDGFGSGRQGRPYPFVTVQVTAKGGADEGRIVARLKPSRRGLFMIALRPGEYVLEPLVQKDGPAPLRTTVTVTAGAFARALVYVEGP